MSLLLVLLAFISTMLLFSYTFDILGVREMVYEGGRAIKRWIKGK
jgi:hypothetical protein